MNKYERLMENLSIKGYGKMKCFGNSMLPILDNPSLNTFIKQDEYEIGDIVFCKVKGRFIDSHLITQIGERGYMISNNHGYQNGWTKTIYGKVISTENNNKIVKYFDFTEEKLNKLIENELD